MNLAVRRVNGRWVVELPDEVARALNAHDGGTLNLEPTEKGYRLSASSVRAEVMEAHRRSMEEFGELYEKLAK